MAASPRGRDRCAGEGPGRVGCGPGRFRPHSAVELRALGERRLRGRRILEVGAGDGRLTFLMAPLVREIVAIDPDTAALDRARARAREEGVRNVRFRAATAQHPDVGRDRFDLVLFSWAL